MNINIPEINHSYIYPTDTEENKDNILNQAKNDNKEACWVGYGVGDLNSQYQPSPIKEPDYYMQYCNSDNYDYLKDYRLIWGYGIGIIETDVIVNTDTGEHLAEGTEECDSYIAEEGINTKRGVWLRFTGSTLINPSVIREVILPDYIISIKDFTSSLTSSQLTIEHFNSENIINWDNTFSNKHINFINSDNSEVTFDLTSTKSMKHIFDTSYIQNEVKTVTTINFINNNNNINLEYAFNRSYIFGTLDNLFLNYSGGAYMFSNAYIYAFPNTFYITLYDATFYNTKGNISITTFDDGHYKLPNQVGQTQPPFYNVPIKIKAENIDYTDCEYINELYYKCTFLDTLDLSNLPNIEINNFISVLKSDITIKWPSYKLNKYEAFIINNNANYKISFENICYCAEIGDIKPNIGQGCIIFGYNLNLNVKFCGVGAIEIQHYSSSYYKPVTDNSNIEISYYDNIDIPNIFDDTDLSENKYFQSCITVFRNASNINNLIDSITATYFPTTIINSEDRSEDNIFHTITIDVRDKPFYNSCHGVGGYNLIINKNTVLKSLYDKNSTYPLYYNTYRYYINYINDEINPVTTPIDNYVTFVNGEGLDFNTYSDVYYFNVNNIYLYYGNAGNTYYNINIIKSYNKIIYKDIYYSRYSIIKLSQELNIKILYDWIDDSNDIYINIVAMQYTIDEENERFTWDSIDDFIFDLRDAILEYNIEKPRYIVNAFLDYIPYSWLNNMYNIINAKSPEKALHAPAIHYIDDTDDRNIDDVINTYTICRGDLGEFEATLLQGQNGTIFNYINRNIDPINTEYPLIIPNNINIYDLITSSQSSCQFKAVCKNTELHLKVTTDSHLLFYTNECINLETLTINEYTEIDSYENTISLYLSSDNKYTSKLKNVTINRSCEVIRADYATQLTSESVNNLFNAVTKSITINEIIYATLTEEQISSLTDKGVTLISINNE